MPDLKVEKGKPKRADKRSCRLAHDFLPIPYHLQIYELNFKQPNFKCVKLEYPF